MTEKKLTQGSGRLESWPRSRAVAHAHGGALAQLGSYSRPPSVGHPSSKRTAPGRLLTTGQRPRVGFLSFSDHHRGPNIAP